MQLLFDLKRSHKSNPPNYPANKGINFVERESGKVAGLVVEDSNGLSLQPRIKTLEDQQRSLEDSYKVNGVLYNKQVMVVEARLDGQKELISGFGRKAALKDMEVTDYFWDVVTFDSPYWKAIWKRRLNQSADHTAQGTPNTEGTYLKGLQELKRVKGFKFRDDDAVRLALFEMSDGKMTEDSVEKVLKKFRKSNSTEEGVIALIQREANSSAQDLHIPSNGYVSNEKAYPHTFGSVGYVRHDGDLSNKIVDIVNNYNKLVNEGYLIHPDDEPKINITGFIQHVVHDKIHTQRKDWLKKFEKSKDWMREHLHVDYHDILEFKGFIAQINTRDESQGGKPRERGLVDVNGKIIREKV
tara:strand:- start:59 stop:1126 length:1068 start_codon:yes stop_codon:yes gene_type:complete